MECPLKYGNMDMKLTKH